MAATFQCPQCGKKFIFHDGEPHPQCECGYVLAGPHAAAPVSARAVEDVDSAIGALFGDKEEEPTSADIAPDEPLDAISIEPSPPDLPLPRDATRATFRGTREWPTLEQVAMQAAYVEVKKQEKKWQMLRIMLMVGFACLALSSLVFPPMLLVCVFLVAIATIITGIIGNILLIVHAFRNDDITSGIVMVLSFAFPFLWVYTLYYMVKKWDGTAPFQLTAWALCGLGMLLIVEAVFLLA